MRHRVQRVWHLARVVARVIAAEIGADEIGLGAAIALLAAGFREFWHPGMYLAPAAVILWMCLPQRAQWFKQPPVIRKGRRG